jgi:hypothetical protein
VCIAVAKKVTFNPLENKKEYRMNSTKTIVKQTLTNDIDLRRSAEATAGTAGRKVGQETHIEITPDRIRIRAYEISMARNGGPGDATADWCQAERELNGKADAGPACDDSIADPAVLEVKSRSEAERRPATAARDGL